MNVTSSGIINGIIQPQYGGRGVSPLVQVLGTFNVKLSCARVSPIRMKRIGHNKD